MSGITCGNCKGKHDSIGAVRACYGQPVPTTVQAPATYVAPYPGAPGFGHPAATVQRVEYPASEKQVAFIKRLAGERVWDQGDSSVVEKVFSVTKDLPVSKREASDAITYLQGCAKKSVVAAATGADLKEGMYRKDGRIFRLYHARSASKHLLAKELVDEGGSWSFIYRGVPARLGLRSEHRMARDEAAEFGRQYGVCCVCGAALTDPESVAAGIGPICGGRDYYAA